MSLASLTPQLVSEKFSIVARSLNRRKGALFFATVVGLGSYPLLSRLNANRFVCLSLPLLPLLLTAEWSIRRFQKESAEAVADAIWLGADPNINTPISNQERVRVVELLSQKMEGVEVTTPASVVYFLLRANGWNDLNYFRSVSHKRHPREVVKIALDLSVSDDKRIGFFKIGYGGRPLDQIHNLAEALSKEKEIGLELVKEACQLLANHRRWFNKLDSL